MRALPFAVFAGVVFVVLSTGSAAAEYRYRLDLIGSNGLMVGSQTSDIDVDPARNVAYLGSYVDLGVAVVDIRDRTNPVVVDILTTDYVGADDRVASSDSADVDINGDLLAVASQTFS